MDSFKWFLCNDEDASAYVFNGINSLLVPRTCCFNGNYWHEDVCRSEVRIFDSLWVCRTVGAWPCLLLFFFITFVICFLPLLWWIKILITSYRIASLRQRTEYSPYNMVCITDTRTGSFFIVSFCTCAVARSDRSVRNARWIRWPGFIRHWITDARITAWPITFNNRNDTAPARMADRFRSWTLIRSCNIESVSDGKKVADTDWLHILISPRVSATLLLLLPPPKEGGYVFTYVCLSVCLSVCPLDYSKSFERILMKFLGEWAWPKQQSIRF